MDLAFFGFDPTALHLINAALFTQASPFAQFELGREAFTGSAEDGIEWRTTPDPDSLERVGVRSGALFFFRLDARREDGSGRARSRVAQVHVP